MKYKVGIIGYGKMGQIRHHAIDKVGKAEVKALSEPTLGSDYGKIPNLTNDNLIHDPSIDAVIICAPNYLNKPLTVKALNANKHVFCEKPPAFTGADIIEIREVEARNNKKLMYGFNHRHHDSIKKMKELIDHGSYGKVLWLRGRYGKSVTKDFFHHWRAKKETSGGGIVLDQGIHMLDLFLYLSGDFDVVKAEVSNLYWKMDVEDNAFIILKDSKSGRVASLHSTMTQWRHLFSLEIFMEKGYMVLNGLLTSSNSYGEEVLSVAKNRTAAPAATWEDEVKTQYHTDNSWRYEMEHFFNSIEQNTPIATGNSEDALKLMKIVDEIYKQKDF